MKRFLVVLSMALLCAGLSQAEIKFLRGPLSEAIKKAETEKKPVMIDFVTDWCRWCDTLDARTYSDAKVADFVNSRLVPIKIDAEKGEGIEIAKKYAVRAYPTILLIKADGEEIDRLLGYMPPDQFMKGLDDYLKGVNTISALKATLEKKPDDPEANYALAKKLSSRNDLAQAAGYYQKLLQLDPSDNLKHAEEARFAIAANDLQTKKDPAAMQAFVDKYPSSPVGMQSQAMLMSFYIKQKKGDEAKQAFEKLIASRPNDAGLMNNYAWSCQEQKLNLDHAAEVSARSVSLAKDDNERAMYLDTQAAVEFQRGNRDKAITLQEKAVALLKDAPAKERKQYEDTLARYKSGQAATK